MARTENTYDAAGTINTSMDRTGVNIGRTPDFWADVADVYKNLRPVSGMGAGGMQQTAAKQASALGRPRTARPSTQTRTRTAQYGEQPTGFDPRHLSARSFGRPSMSPQGVLGTLVNPLDVPLAYQGIAPTGFFGDDAHSNYTYSPTVNPSRWATGQIQREQRR